MPDKELALGIVQQWTDEGMTRADAIALFTEIATAEPTPYLPSIDIPEPVQVAEPVLVNQPVSAIDFLLSLKPEERKVFLLNEKVESEQYWVQYMTEGFKQDRSYTMQEIRTQRKGVQQWVKRLNVARKTLRKSESSTKPSQS